MNLAVFDTHAYEREAFTRANARYGHALTYLEPRLTRETAPLARRWRGQVSSLLTWSARPFASARRP